MHKKNNNSEKVKSKMHSRNKNKDRYDLKLLIENYADLAAFVKPNKYGNDSIDFADPNAVKALNKAILKAHYKINYWDIPKNYLCPPIPGRADYIHYVADLLRESNGGKIPLGNKVVAIDIGVGANCIYPIIGVAEYGWSFIGTDIDEVAVRSANKIINNNDDLRNKVSCRLQKIEKNIFKGILTKDDVVDLVICNPPFHASAEEARKGAVRKQKNLKYNKNNKSALNFGGQSNELWCGGGELRFVQRMIIESKRYATNCFWFTTLVSKQSNLDAVYKKIKEVGAVKTETIAMHTGNKSTRIVAWTFLHENLQKEWCEVRWNKD